MVGRTSRSGYRPQKHVGENDGAWSPSADQWYRAEIESVGEPTPAVYRKAPLMAMNWTLICEHAAIDYSDRMHTSSLRPRSDHWSQWMASSSRNISFSMPTGRQHSMAIFHNILLFVRQTHNDFVMTMWWQWWQMIWLDPIGISV